MKKQHRFVAVLWTLAVLGLFWGCAEKSTALLAEEPVKMSNEELLRYFYRLNDAIDSQEKQQGPQVGFGIGGFGRGSGVGVGMTTGGTGYTAEDLRKRRIDVRMELNRRGLNP